MHANDRADAVVEAHVLCRSIAIRDKFGGELNLAVN